MRPLTETRVSTAATGAAEAITATEEGCERRERMSGDVCFADARLLGLAAAAAAGEGAADLGVLLLRTTLALLLTLHVQPRMSSSGQRKKKRKIRGRERKMFTTDGKSGRKQWTSTVADHFFSSSRLDFFGKKTTRREETMPPSTRSTRSRSAIGASPVKLRPSTTSKRK